MFLIKKPGEMATNIFLKKKKSVGDVGVESGGIENG